MFDVFAMLLAWLPTPLNVICEVVIWIFLIFTVLHLIRFILELIPFL